TLLRLKEKEIERSTKWANMSKSTVINNENLYHFALTEKFKKRVFKGVPDCWRREAWYFLITDCLQETTRDLDIQQMYHRLLKKGSEHEHQIDLDIPRTLRGHIMFKQRYGSGQRSLFNVLRAFSNYDMEVGYCQGMTNVAATILMYCEEEKAFAVMVHMFLRDNLRNLYIPGFPTLMESFFIQESLLMKYLPKVSRHLTSLGLPSDAYSTRWYITLFTGGVVQYDTQLRIWDIYFLHGYDIFFFIVIVLFHIHQKKILESDLDHCMEILGSTLSVPDNNKFMKSVEKLYLKNVRSDTIATLRREYQTKV
ncbi:RabGAP/TBC, partial [Backusella circina FSU 941]